MDSVPRQATTLILAASLMSGLASFAFAQNAPVSIPAAVEALQHGRTAEALRITAELLRVAP